MPTPLIIDGKKLQSRLFMGSAGYPCPKTLQDSIFAANAGLVTVSLRRENAGGSGSKFWALIKETNIPILPNTAGCYSAKQAITTAQMAREVFDTNWIKLETIGDDYTLAPNPNELTKAAEVLIDDGFFVFPYMTDDIDLANKLSSLGCRVLMPWGAPIGSGLGLQNPRKLKTMRESFPNHTLIVDAGIGNPSDAAKAMELGFDGVLLNTAIAKSKDPVAMAKAFAKSVEAGHEALRAGLIAPQETACPSTPVVGTPFWHIKED